LNSISAALNLFSRTITGIVLCAAFGTGAWGQAVPDTSLKQPIPDSARIHKKEVLALPNDAAGVRYKPEPWQPNPKKAGMYSALLPGAGQLYNRQYWKIGVIYAGIGASAYFLKFNMDQYRTYRKAYIARIDSDPNTTDEYEGLYSADALKQLQDGYKRYLDITVLLTFVGYTVQVLDAVAFAHLTNFDVTPDLSLKMTPVIIPQGGVGLGLVVNFK
jgi:hypothetical protein